MSNRLGICIGDITGIGPEVTLKAVAEEMKRQEGFDYLLIGDETHLWELNEKLGLGLSLEAEKTGSRELTEETGYVGGRARLIGEIFPNPAIMSNHCYTVLIENCRCLGKVKFDDGEDLATRLVPVAEIPGLVAGGKIRHSLVVVGLYYYELWRRGFRRGKRGA